MRDKAFLAKYVSRQALLAPYWNQKIYIFFFILDKVTTLDLTKMKKKEGLTPNQEKLLGILEYKNYKIIRRGELTGLILKYKVSENPYYLIKSMLQKRRLVHFKRGSYIVIPMKSVSKTTGVNEFELNEYFLESGDYYIGLYNAFHLHHFTGQVPNKMFIFNTKYSSDRKILNYKYKYIKISRVKLFGITTKYKYPYSDRERTIIDVLDYPDYLGGLFNVVTSIKKSKFNKKRLADYAVRYKSVKIMKLAGWLTNSTKIYQVLKKNNSLSYYTTVKGTGMAILNKKWKIRII